MTSSLNIINDNLNNGMVVFYDSDQVNEVSFNDKSIFMSSGDEITEEDIDRDFILIFEVEEVDLYDEITDYQKKLKKSIRTLANIEYSKKLTVFSIGGNFTLDPEILIEDYFNLSFISENWHEMELYIFTRIKF